MFFLASTDLIDPKEAPKSVKSLGIVFSILVLGHIGSQGAVTYRIKSDKTVKFIEKYTENVYSRTIDKLRFLIVGST